MSPRSLESELRDLAAGLRWPPTPDLAERVLVRIEADEPAAASAPRSPRSPGSPGSFDAAARVVRARRPWLRPALALGHGSAVAVAAIVTLLVAGALVSPVRSAVLDVLGIAGRERVVRVPGAPDTSRPQLDAGRPTTLARAQQRLAFAIRLPRALGTPSAVRYSDSIAGGAVTLLYPRTALLEYEGGTEPVLLKRVGPSAHARPVDVGGAPGLFITGVREIDVLDRDGHVLQATRSIARADVLVWQRGGVAFRLETRDTMRRALAIARSIR
ncbi:MAG TPA: hypothetical protein VGO80_15150 [Solirubrobacteraceae bacterium]|jgi:hypothetical protein|nr:hypothetical protein [Solirubrobacteraceae bacterium]